MKRLDERSRLSESEVTHPLIKEGVDEARTI